MRIWGVGIRLLVLTFLYGMFMLGVDRLIFQVSNPAWFPDGVLYPVLITLLVIGIPYLVLSGKKLTADFDGKSLITDGVFGYVRNPIYSAWILFIIPAVCLLSRSVLVMTTPVFAYLLFRTLVREEEMLLQKEFGEAYDSYRRQVNQIVPWFRRKA